MKSAKHDPSEDISMFETVTIMKRSEYVRIKYHLSTRYSNSGRSAIGQNQSQITSS